MKTILYITLLFTTCFSCKKPGDRACYKSTGKNVSEVRILDNFSTIILNDNIQLNISQSTENKATINSGKNLTKWIKTEVIDGVLHISNENKCNNLRSRKRPISINLDVSNLTQIKHFGTKGIQFLNTIKSDSLSIESIDGHGEININFEGDYLATIFHSGTCKVSSKGNVRESFVYQISNGYTDNSQLSAKIGHIHSRTIQDCFIAVDSVLTAEIHGSGNVYYKDNVDLSLSSKVKGSGLLIPQ